MHASAAPTGARRRVREGCSVFVVALLQREVRGAALHDRMVKNYGPGADRTSNVTFMIAVVKD